MENLVQNLLLMMDHLFFRFETNEYKALLGIYVNNKEALNFLQNYQHDDIVAVTFIKQSASEWSITPPERDLLTYFVNSSNVNLFKA